MHGIFSDHNIICTCLMFILDFKVQMQFFFLDTNLNMVIDVLHRKASREAATHMSGAYSHELNRSCKTVNDAS